jgi:GNAT superfamily N-acetyltransferase
MDIIEKWNAGNSNVLMLISGTEVFSTKEKYVMPVVDTAYIRSEYRNRGFGTEILSDVIARFPDEDIGFSTPISSGMLKSKCPISGYCCIVPTILVMMNPL